MSWVWFPQLCSSKKRMSGIEGQALLIVNYITDVTHEKTIVHEKHERHEKNQS